MKKIFLIISVIILILIGLSLIYYVKFVGITKKQKYDNCLETCKEMMLNESSKQYCSPRCIEVTGYNPSEQEKQPEQEKQLEQKKQLEQEKQPINNKVIENTNEVEYYCEWSWPQKVIIRDTKKVIQSCTFDRPWCNKADGSLENVGCCKTTDYTDCLKTKNYLNNK